MTSFQRVLSQIVPSRICLIIFNVHLRIFAFITVFVISDFDSYYSNVYRFLSILRVQCFVLI